MVNTYTVTHHIDNKHTFTHFKHVMCEQFGNLSVGDEIHAWNGYSTNNMTNEMLKSMLKIGDVVGVTFYGQSFKTSVVV